MFIRLDEIFNKIQKFENKSLNIDAELNGEICQTGFKIKLMNKHSAL